MQDKKKKKSGGFLTTIILTAIALGIVLGILKANNVNNVDGFIDLVKTKSTQWSDCVISGKCNVLKNKSQITKKIFDNNKNSSVSTQTNDSSLVQNNKGLLQTTKAKSIEKLNNIKIGNPQNVDYKRSDWKHWIQYGKNACWNIREEALSQQAVEGSVVYLDKNKKETKDKSKACYIAKGKWIDVWTGEEYTNPKDLDVDHTFPLGAIAEMGGQEYDKKTKEKIANDLEHLVVTSAKLNRAKGKKRPEEFMPPKNKCEYAKIYINIAEKYNLKITQKDKEVLNNALNTCQN